MPCIVAMAISALLHGVALAGPTPPSAAPQEEVIVKYDMTALNGWNLSNATTRRSYFDQTQFVTSLQGLANRQSARLFVRYNATQDDFWWARMTQTNGWLAGRTVQNATSITDLLTRFSSVYNGVVVWDERVLATANLASTIAGCDNLLAIRYDTTTGSLYQQMVLSGPQLPVVVRLMATDGSPMFTGQGTIPGTTIPSSGSAKCDAYLWLVENYLKTGKVDPKRLGYYVDGYWLTCYASAARTNHCLNNHDFLIARHGLIFDLGVWEDETPVDDRTQPLGTDVATMKAILRAAYDRINGNGIIHVAGFVPWAYKYTTWASAGGTHETVPTEWRYAEILTCHNAYMDADSQNLANMANASFFQHYPLAASYPQPNKPTRESLIAKGVLDATGKIQQKRYVAHYVGDYDSAAWLYQKMPTIWMDSQRGTEPLAWAFNPNLSERFPFGMAWMRQTATANDSFVAGDSGAGYVNPGHLVPPRPFSGLPSGLAAWEAHCQRFFSQWDISVVGVAIDGNAPCMNNAVMDAYARIAPDGIVAQKVPLQGAHNNMPFSRMRYDLSSTVTQAVDQIETFFTRPVPQFDVFRSILQSPYWYKQVDDELRRRRGSEVMVVDLPTLMWLIREYKQHPEVYLWPQSPYAGVAQVRALPGSNLGLTPLVAGDGPVTVVQSQGRSAWQVAATQFLYFGVDDGFHRRNAEPIYVAFDYYDQGTGLFLVEYDASDFDASSCGNYKTTASVARTNSNSWRTATFALPQARFANTQNSNADVRIYNSANNLLISEVRVYYVDTGSLQVTITPPEAVSAGAKWRLTSGSDTGWKDSGTTLSSLPVGSYTVTYQALPPWDKPADVTVVIARDATTTVSGAYVQPNVGSVQVTIQPQGAVNAGAQWRLTSGPDTGWKSSGTIVSALLVGSYAVNFKTLQSWNAPADENISIALDTTTAIGGIYVRRYIGDVDGDGDVDQTDFGYFQACLTGPNITQSNPTCAGAHLDEDADVDQDDFVIFHGCMSGANAPADPNCAD